MVLPPSRSAKWRASHVAGPELGDGRYHRRMEVTGGPAPPRSYARVGLGLVVAAVAGVVALRALGTGTSHELEVAADPECTVCFLQRRGSARYAVGHLFGLSDPEADVRFGHCIACISCEGDSTPTCTGFWSDDPHSTGLWVETGSVSADGNEPWDQGACYFTTREVGERARSAAIDVPPDYQVLGLGGTSCLSYCTDIAGAIGVGVGAAWGPFTVPGGLSWVAPHWRATPEGDEPAHELMYRADPTIADVLLAIEEEQGE